MNPYRGWMKNYYTKQALSTNSRKIFFIINGWNFLEQKEKEEALRDIVSTVVILRDIPFIHIQPIIISVMLWNITFYLNSHTEIHKAWNYIGIFGYQELAGSENLIIIA